MRMRKSDSLPHAGAHRRLALGLLLAAIWAPPAAADTPQAAFTAAWQRWQTSGPRSYHFTLLRSCFCPGVQPLRITVEDGRVREARHTSDGTPQDRAETASLPSIDDIFKTIGKAYAKPADRIELTLNPAYGYPEHVFIDYDQMMADEELIYDIRDLAP